jgi:alpha-1,6-mannosyltransferase
VSIGLPAATGLIGSVCVVVGAAQPGSPFTVQGAGAWFFGTGSGAPVTPDHRFVGVILVYVGIASLLGSWYEVVRTVRARPGTPVGHVAGIFAAWALPVLVGPVLFSGDVYSYVAQGQMVTKGINPYVHGPSALGRGSFLRLVDPQWRHTPAPYGPGWERLSGWIVTVSGHDVRVAVIGFRLVALFGVTVLAVAVAALARSLGRDPAFALALAVLNPLVVLDLLGGSHNDALMLGLLVAGCALARRHQVVAGLALCTLAAEVKIPALIGVVFIGWWWAGAGAGGRERLERLVLAVGSVAGAMVVIGAVAGLGWRWVSALSNPGAVVSWLDPATAVGLAAAHVAGAFGDGGHQAGFVDGARAIGVAVAAVITIGLLLRARGPGELSALGWSLLAVVVLGPVVWPWYETWGLVFLAVEAEGWTVPFVFIVAALACVADVPRPGILVAGDPVLVSVCWAALAALAVLFVATRVVAPARWRHGLRSARL